MLKNLKFTISLLLFCCFMASAIAQGTLKGKVVDENNVPIIGGSVVIEGTTTGTVTNLDGDFTLEVPSGEIQLSISFIGFITQVATVNITDGKESVLNITLKEDLKELDEVVVIGYGSQKKSDLTGAVASVSSEELNAVPVGSVQEALQGRAAGVQASGSTGAPGADVKIKIRGTTSINGTDPLWIVDGIPTDPKTVSPNDIQSIEILKDASTAAIYGANGANGVVLVTTKKGEAGKIKTSFNMYLGNQEQPNRINVASGPEFGQMYSEYEAILRKRSLTYPTPDTLPTTNYQDEVFQKAPMQNYELSIAGGGENSTFYLGIGYLTQDGVVKNSGYDKTSLRLNSEHQVHKWIKLGQNFSFVKETYKGFEEWQLKSEYATPILQALQFHQMVPVYNPDGPQFPEYENDQGWSATPHGNITNPMANIGLLNQERDKYSGKFNLYGVLEPIKGLTYKTVFSAGVTYGDGYNMTPRFFLTASNNNNQSKIYRSNSIYKTWQWQNYITYTKTLFNAHHLSVMAGFEAAEHHSHWQNAERLDMFNESPEMWYFDASQNSDALSQLPSGSGNESSGYSYFGRVSYDYKSMILFQGNVRKDYSSKFGPKNRSKVFPSFSVGFKFSELNLFKNLSYFSFGKIRYGWGQIGYNSVPDYIYYATVDNPLVYHYPILHEAAAFVGAGKNQIPNLAVKWETVVTNNIGVDLRFLNSKLSLTADYFEKYNDGMLMQVEVPGHAGYIVREEFHEGGRANPIDNVGKLSNKGFELTVGWKNTHGKFSYSADVNFTYLKMNTEKLTPLSDTITSGSAKGFGQNLIYTIVGETPGEYHGYIVDRIFREEDAEEIDGETVVTNQPTYIDQETGETQYAQPDAQPGDFKFKDINGDGIINEGDIGPMGNPNPKYLLGINLDFEYGWFDFNMFFQGVFGNKIFNATKFYQFNQDGGFNWSSDYVNDHYLGEDLYDRRNNLVASANQNAEYPRLDPTNANDNWRLSDFYMEDGSYLRLKNLQLGVTIPGSVTQKIGVERFRIYIGAKNLWTSTKYSGFDPEVGEENALVVGLDKAAYPVAKVYTVGINLNF